MGWGTPRKEMGSTPTVFWGFGTKTNQRASPTYIKQLHGWKHREKDGAESAEETFELIVYDTHL